MWRLSNHDCEKYCLQANEVKEGVFMNRRDKPVAAKDRDTNIRKVGFIVLEITRHGGTFIAAIKPGS